MILPRFFQFLKKLSNIIAYMNFKEFLWRLYSQVLQTLLIQNCAQPRNFITLQIYMIEGYILQKSKESPGDGAQSIIRSFSILIRDIDIIVARFIKTLIMQHFIINVLFCILILQFDMSKFSLLSSYHSTNCLFAPWAI